MLLSLKSIEHTCLVSQGGEEVFLVYCVSVTGSENVEDGCKVKSDSRECHCQSSWISPPHSTVSTGNKNTIRGAPCATGGGVHSGRFSHKQNQRHVFKSISMLSTANACVCVTGGGGGYNRYFTASSVTVLFFFVVFFR